MHLFSSVTAADSFVHRLDPTVKMLASIFLLGMVSVIQSWKGFAGIVVFLFVMSLCAHVSLLQMAKKLKTFVWFFLFTGIIHLFFTPGESLPFFPFGCINVTYDGVIRAGTMISRLSIVILVASLLTFTTVPIDIAKGIEGLLSPFRRFIPGIHTFTTMVVLTMQFIPLLLTKAEKEMKSQKALWERERYGLKEKVKNLSSFVDSYVSSVLQDVDTML